MVKKLISVAMATYNGERFIAEQLDSIFSQTVLPDEIVISDDNSSDNTLKIIESYCNKGIRIILINNSQNQGYRRNFYKAIKECSGDYVFLCDQDDIWEKNKIELMASQMQSNKNILLLCSNLKTFYVENCENKVREKSFFSRKQLIKLDDYKNFVNTPRPGCTFCISKDLVNLYVENVDFSLFHDNLLWHLASINNGCFLLNKQLILYRRHSSNASNNKENTMDKRLVSIKEQIKSIDYLLNKSKDIRIRQFLVNQKKVFQKRFYYLEKKNLCALLSLIRYKEYYTSIRLWLVDLYYCIKVW